MLQGGQVTALPLTSIGQACATSDVILSKRQCLQLIFLVLMSGLCWVKASSPRVNF